MKQQSFFLGLFLFQSTAAYRILLYHDGGTRSHLQLLYPLAEELLSRGHEVVGVYYSSAKISHKNYTELVIPDFATQISKNFSEVYMTTSKSSLGIADPRIWLQMVHLWPWWYRKVSDVIYSKDLDDIISAGKIDLAVGMSWNVAYIADRVDCNVVYFTPFGPYPGVSRILGNQFFPSQFPMTAVFFEHPELMSQRALNLVTNLFFDMVFPVTNYIMYYIMQTEHGYTGPHANEIYKRRLQLALANSHTVTHDPQPFLENVVEVGGMHLKAAKPLPKDLQKFLDDSPEGVIYVSFGSTITPSSMGEAKRKEFVKAFSMLKQKIIWKWDGEITDDIPANVLVQKWLPQQDLLAHPNLKVFVTHGGLLSVQEAIYHGTILVGTPLANDQKPNLKRVESNNVGRMLDWEGLTAEVLVQAVETALTDASMAAAMQRLSARFKDTKEHPVEKAAWWLEFVIRNNGAEFLKPRSMNQAFYQAWNLDILAVVIVCSLIGLYVNFKILKFCCSFCCSRKKMKSE